MGAAASDRAGRTGSFSGKLPCDESEGRRAAADAGNSYSLPEDP